MFQTEIAKIDEHLKISEVTKKAISEGYDIIVGVGGDGTINEIAQILVDTNYVLGIIPLGSGNGLARFLKIPFKLEDALNLIKNGEAISIDTIQLNIIALR
jgi:diacylglycerol kinase family enzyme